MFKIIETPGFTSYIDEANILALSVDDNGSSLPYRLIIEFSEGSSQVMEFADKTERSNMARKIENAMFAYLNGDVYEQQAT